MSEQARMPVKPFDQCPGRDVTRDRRPDFDVAAMYHAARFDIAADAERLNELIAAIDSPNELVPTQWAQWYSVALGFEPHLILELGRGRGNSTAAFAQAASRMATTKIVSLCMSDCWSVDAVPRLEKIVPPEWFRRIDARVADILTTDYDPILAGHRRVLVVWDAHGFDIAQIVLGQILPRLAARPHLVIMHDISDNRYAAVPRSYGGEPLWKGSCWQQATGAWGSRVNIGWMNSVQDQVIALADFAARNDIEIGSADHEYAQFFGAQPDYADEMQRLLGERFFSLTGHWAFLSLSGKEPPFHFPGSTLPRFEHESAAIVEEIYPSPTRRVRLPRTFETASVRWAYAGLITCQPSADLPADARPSLRLLVHVEGGTVGIGLLNPDQSDFLERRRIAPARESQIVLLPIVDRAAVGPVVVHTWDAPEPARVRIDDIAMVW